MKKILFLDIEGVLINDNGKVIDSAMKHFKQIIYDTGAVIVSINEKYDDKYLVGLFGENNIEVDIKGNLKKPPFDFHGDELLEGCLCRGNAIEYYLNTMDWKNEPYTYVIIDTDNDYLLKQGCNLISVDTSVGFSDLDEKEAIETLGVIPSHRYIPSKVRHPKLVYIPQEPEPVPYCCQYKSEQERERENKEWKREMEKYEQKRIEKKNQKKVDCR